VIYATPVYIMAMSSLLKTLLEGMYSTVDKNDLCLSNGLIHDHANRQISSKPFIPLILCSNIEHETSKNVLSCFRTYARLMEAGQVGTLVRSGTQMFEGRDTPKMGEKFPGI